MMAPFFPWSKDVAIVSKDTDILVLMIWAFVKLNITKNGILNTIMINLQIFKTLALI